MYHYSSYRLPSFTPLCFQRQILYAAIFNKMPTSINLHSFRSMDDFTWCLMVIIIIIKVLLPQRHKESAGRHETPSFCQSRRSVALEWAPVPHLGDECAPKAGKAQSGASERMLRKSGSAPHHCHSQGASLRTCTVTPGHLAAERESLCGQISSARLQVLGADV